MDSFGAEYVKAAGTVWLYVPYFGDIKSTFKERTTGFAATKLARREPANAVKRSVKIRAGAVIFFGCTPWKRNMQQTSVLAP